MSRRRATCGHGILVFFQLEFGESHVTQQPADVAHWPWVGVTSPITYRHGVLARDAIRVWKVSCRKAACGPMPCFWLKPELGRFTLPPFRKKSLAAKLLECGWREVAQWPANIDLCSEFDPTVGCARLPSLWEVLLGLCS